MRTRFLLVIGFLFLGSLAAFEGLTSRALGIEFDRQGQEMVSLLSTRGRERLEAFLNSAERGTRGLTRLFVPQSRTLREPGSSLLHVFGLRAIAVFEKTENSSWEWRGPELESQRTPPHVPLAWNASGSLLAREGNDWRLWMGQGSRSVGTSLESASLESVLPESRGGLRSFLFLREGGRARLADSTALRPDEGERWRRWVESAGGNEKVETLRWNGRDYYASLSPSAMYDFAILSLWPVDEVQASWSSLRRRIHALVAALAALAVIAILLTVRSLTSPLEELEGATARVAAGDFEIAFPRRRRDEVGRLMGAFEAMSGQIMELMRKTAQGARMEVELNAARLVQENFYPQRENEFSSVRVLGRTWAASECGGDLWGCWETEAAVYVVVADATGHGVPAALMTGALRSAIAIFESSRQDDLLELAKAFRHAVESTGRGRMCMTAFLLRLEKATGMVQYVNAGHDSSYVIPATVTEQTSWKKLGVLFEPVNPTLGDPTQGPSQAMAISLSLRERIFICTDGIAELKDAEGREWKPREILNALLEAFKEAPDLPRAFDRFESVIQERRGAQELADDLSVVLIEWGPRGPRD